MNGMGERPPDDRALAETALRVEPKRDVVAERMGDELVLVHLGTNRIYTLNPTAARAWELWSEGNTTDVVHERLSGEFDVSSDALTSELRDLVEALCEQALVEVA